MARVRVNYKQLERLQRRISKFADVDMEAFNIAMVKELAARLLAKVIKRTPVDTGVLRRGWTIGQVKKIGDMYEIEVINNIEYASYKEFGHRTRNHQGWVNGRFMMTISADELEQQAPAIIERKLKAKLMEVFK
ncbi:HK97 gp10 family phage protein [Metasolibacillus sp.]|uniref:HK97 gp10 family phage protein n=1 Tax=Metasolibacillus sp. TaxID=2703680 RepID=UPI0025F24599|nr:HK97 gp10 family phage protein [Metasolibacillus sp.]MCT6924091.1 HK97 gp10 family phage protein [Metasolibacillus sp.]MCT6940198.1 HK97 gp10 family phage protein [Metasolibacillus sp.]